MRKAFAALFLVAMGVALSGCAVPARVAGRDFPRQAFARFTLKQTNPEIVQAMLGSPLRQSTVRGTVTNPRSTLPIGTPFSVTIYTYSFALLNGGAATSRHPAVKVATLVFYDGTPAAYDVNSTIPGDEDAGFDERKLGLLQPGVTTRAGVIALFGTPNGQSIKLENVPAQSGMVAYGRIEVRGSDIHRRTLRILLDDRDVVTSYTMLDNTMPANAPLLPPVYRGLVPQARPPGVIPRQAPGLVHS